MKARASKISIIIINVPLLVLTGESHRTTEMGDHLSTWVETQASLYAGKDPKMGKSGRKAWAGRSLLRAAFSRFRPSLRAGGQVDAKKSYRKAGMSLSLYMPWSPYSTLSGWVDINILHSGPPSWPPAHLLSSLALPSLSARACVFPTHSTIS